MEDIVDLLRAWGMNESSSPLLTPNETFMRQPLQSLAHRISADTELAGKVVLNQMHVRSQNSIDNRLL
jgi:hypothetical protein